MTFYLLIFNLLFLPHLANDVQPEKTDRKNPILDIPNLICFWDFQKNAKGQTYLTSQGPYQYTLQEMNGPIVRAEGGPTPGRPWAFSYATGKTKPEEDTWYMIAFTHNHEQIKVYYDGQLDRNENYNPFDWDKPIFDGGEEGTDFTVAQRDVHSWPDYPEGIPGNKVGFGGSLGVFDRALSAEEVRAIYESASKIGSVLVRIRTLVRVCNALSLHFALIA